jgi:hypothetical protein
MRKPQLVIVSYSNAQRSACSSNFVVDPNNMAASRREFEERVQHQQAGYKEPTGGQRKPVRVVFLTQASSDRNWGEEGKKGALTVKDAHNPSLE